MTTYSAKEEKINIISHAFGLLLSCLGFVLLEVLAFRSGESIHIWVFGIFGMSLMTLYAASTLYHSTKEPKRRTRLRIIDHAAIYVLIAGTYTPFTLITMKGTSGEAFFIVLWVIALCGIIMKIFFTGKFTVLSTIMYVLMGAVVFIDIKPLLHNLPQEGLNWLLVGGIAYVVGAIVYILKGIKYNHAIFHMFVLMGSFSHFMAVYFYVIPMK